MNVVFSSFLLYDIADGDNSIIIIGGSNMVLKDSMCAKNEMKNPDE